MDNQLTFTDFEYERRRRITKKEEFLNEMDKVVPWKEWVDIITPFYPNGHRGRRPIEIETMLRMFLLQKWFDLSDEGVEDAIFDSFAMRKFVRVDFVTKQAPDATTLCKFRKLLNDHNLSTQFFEQVKDVLAREGKLVHGGVIVDATIVEASSNTKNEQHATDPEMHSVKKRNKWYFGMREHIAVDPLHGYVQTTVSTAANAAEVKVAPQLLRKDDYVVYGDSGYLKMDRYVTDGVEREYKINRQVGTFKFHYNDSLAWAEEKKIESRKSSVRSKVEHVFHIVKDIFHWRKAKYKGIYKNDCAAKVLFACANLYMLAKGA